MVGLASDPDQKSTPLCLKCWESQLATRALSLGIWVVLRCLTEDDLFILVKEQIQKLPEASMTAKELFYAYSHPEAAYKGLEDQENVFFEGSGIKSCYAATDMVLLPGEEETQVSLPSGQYVGGYTSDLGHLNTTLLQKKPAVDEGTTNDSLTETKEEEESYRNWNQEYQDILGPRQTKRQTDRC